MNRLRLAAALAVAAALSALALWPADDSCRFARVVVCAPDDPDAGDVDGNDSRCRELLVRVRGPAPDAELPEVPLEARVVEDLGTRAAGTVACPADAPRYTAVPWATASRALFRCACRSRPAAALGACGWRPPGGDGGLLAAPYDQTLPAGTWAGAGCVPIQCSESAEIITLNGGRPGYSLAEECRP